MDSKETDTLRNEHLKHIDFLEAEFKRIQKELHHAYIQLKVYDDFKGY